ncbi:MAG: MBL fold metallo-hydrolase [Deltaproteobacteria bacterium]|nr:MBL fold metallo-hydrolase [Deltaproteobacteria bacterium]
MFVKIIAGNFFSSNCYIVASETTRRGMIVDPGVHANYIMGAVAEMGVTVSLIVLTHVHVDHCVSLETVKNSTKAQLAVFDTSNIQESPEIIKMPKGLLFVPFTLPIKPDILLGDGSIIDIDDLQFSVLHTPGHSKDSVCLFRHGTLFSGDTLFRRSIGISPPMLFPGQDVNQLKNSIREKLLPLPDDTIVHPGHGAPTTIGEERRLNRMLSPERSR